MFDISKLYRWCDGYGGGLVIASSEDEARKKLAEKYSDREIEKMTVWPWTKDDYFDDHNPDVLDIY